MLTYKISGLRDEKHHTMVIRYVNKLLMFECAFLKNNTIFLQEPVETSLYQYYDLVTQFFIF